MRYVLWKALRDEARVSSDATLWTCMVQRKPQVTISRTVILPPRCFVLSYFVARDDRLTYACGFRSLAN